MLRACADATHYLHAPSYTRDHATATIAAALKEQMDTIENVMAEDALHSTLHSTLHVINSIIDFGEYQMN
jgi:hypothetical protein